MTKVRLDQLLVQRNLADTRTKAQALILSGEVLVNDRPVDKAGALIAEDAEIRVRNQSRYVGRGGEKLQGALEDFGLLKLDGLVALDLGASTGGFTDCMLQHGASEVYAVDVGFNQLDLKLRSDPRVHVHEETHAKDLAKIDFSPKPTFATIDVSFIGLRKVLPFVIPVLDNPAKILALVKPQFELERSFVGKGGVVKDEEHQLLAVQQVQQSGESLGLRFVSAVPSKLTGGKKGNQEYFVLFELDGRRQ